MPSPCLEDKMKRLLTGIFALILMLGCITISQPRATAADTPKEITAYLTIALQDADGKYDFAGANDGTSMASKAIQVSDADGDNKLTAYDVLYCAHVQYAPGGLKDFEINSASKGSAILKKAWNVTAGYTLVGENTMATNAFKTDIKSATSTTSINDGTHLYVIQGASAKTEFFSNTASIKMGFINDARITAYKRQAFTLCANIYDASVKMPVKRVSAAKGRAIYYKEIQQGNTPAQKLITTDATGKITVTFENAGDYLLYTAPADSVAPAACMVHVEESKLVPESIRLGLSEDSADLLHYASGTKEYSITVPDSATTLYGRMAYASASGNLQWYSEVSTDGTTYKSVTVKGLLDGKTTGNININGAQKLKLYINDKSLQLAKNKPLSDDYIINIKRQIQLTGLTTTTGTLLSDADYTTGHLDVYVSHDAETATLTPTAKSGDTITVNDAPAESGKAATINLTDAETTAKIIVHRAGDSYVDGTYTVTFHKAADQAAPVFIEQPMSEVQEYIVGDGSAYVKPLHVFANANGTVTYQWYSNTTNSTEGGTAIADATDPTYIPATDTAGDQYYYCVATNGSSTTSSTCAHVIVYDEPIQSISWSMKTPKLPEEKKELFEGHTTGFYYQKGDTNVTPLTVNVTFEPHFAELIKNGKMIVRYNWGPKNNAVKTDLPSYTPSTEYAIGGQEWYCDVTIFYLDYSRNFSKYTVKPVYIYIDDADSSRPGEVDFSGDGTKASPWELANQKDLEKLRKYVNDGYNFADTYLLFTNDITLDTSWESIGTGDAGTKGKGWNVFSGTLDGGNHTLTYAENTDQPLFKYVREATVQNLSIEAPHLKNYALVSNYAVDYGDDGNYSIGTGGSYAPGCPDTIDIINVTIKSGSIIEKGGFLGGFASGANIVNIRDCTAEKDVKIGWDGEKGVGSNNGSFAGLFNGTMSNCVSYADVYGQNFVGGMAGQKGQSMGPYEFTNCSFMGKIEATGKFAGGIAGGGYAADSAPNTPGATIQNCYVSGNITGSDCVGGILGGEPSQLQAWNTSYIQDNCFYGKVAATDKNASCGGIVGRFRSLNINNTISNNYFLDGCGADNGIGAILYLDTSATITAENCTVFNTSEKLPEIGGISRANLNRTDDPLDKDSDKLAAKKTAAEFTDGTVAGLLNASDSSLKNWTTGTNGPVQSREPIFYKLSISGNYKAVYTVGEELDLSDAVFTASRSDGVTENIALSEITISGYDKETRSKQTLTAKWKNLSCTFTVEVLNPQGSNIAVYFTLLGDKPHGDSGTTHTLAENNLTTWVEKTAYSVSNNATVLDVITEAFEENNISMVNESGNYISSVTYDGVTLAEFTNGNLSGWMYTLNGIHTSNDVSEQYLNDKDEIVFHYTDNYTKEDFKGGGDKPTPGSKVTAEELAKAYKDTGDAQALKTPGTGSTEGEWLMLGLARADHTITPDNRSTYLAAVRDYISTRYKDGKLYDSAQFETTVSTDNSRIILALTALGEDPQTFVTGKDLLKGYSDFDWVKKQGINGTIWALLALDSKQYEIPAGTTTRDKLISEILSKQTTNDGWATAGNVADADMTAMAIQALAPYYSRANVKTAVNNALNRLSKAQNNETGAYYNAYNELCAESTAQVIVALTSLGINPTEDGRFITNSGLTLLDGLMHFYNGSGEFKHTVNGQANAMATEQSYYALVSYYRLLNQKSSLYDMSDNGSTPESVESVIEKIKAIPDPVDEDSYEAIVTAREAYEKLTDSEQEQVPQQYRNKLTRAETEYSVLLENAKSQAKSDLTDHYLSLKQEDYGDAGRKKLAEILSTGQKNITSAKSCKQVSTILERAIKEMDEVKKGDMTVTFRLIGSLQATQDVNLTTDSYLPEYVTWIPTTKYELASNATVYDLFTEALSDAGLTSIGAESNYVKTIYAPSCLGGYALSEFTNGKNSGWMYTINGSHPNYGLKEQELKDGDMVVWHYVNDYSHEVSDWPVDSQHPSLGNGTYYNGWLRAADITPERYVEQLLGKIVTIGRHGTVEPKLKLSDIGKSVTFTFKPDKGYRVKDVKVDGKSVGAVTTYKVDKLTVSTRIEVEFTNGKLPFTDVRESDWFYEDVAFAYENGLFAGTSDTTFSPNASMTRAMLVTVLYRLEGQPAVNGRSGFSDVQYNGYYEDAVTWAADNGIVNGTSTTTFSPNANVTREQMAAILYRYAQHKKYNTAASSGLNGFTDHASVSGYAAASLEWAVAEKLVNGSAGKLMPTGNATRAQVAAILHRFVENVATTK